MTTLPDIEGFRAGHATDPDARTGCTAILCEEGATGGVDVMGSAPATLETESLRPGRLSQTVHGLLLTGGSAFGLHAAGGVQAYLVERNAGFDTGDFRVPIVPAAGIYDLGIGNGHVRPDRDMGFRAAETAGDGSLESGQKGAGTGATVGKIFGRKFRQEGGLGIAATELINGIRMAAIVVVNVLGDIIDPDTGDIVAGAYDPGKETFLNGGDHLLNMDEDEDTGFPGNTLIGTILTNLDLTCEVCCSLSESAYNGVSRTVRPAGTMSDGDALFTLSSGRVEASPSRDTLKVAAAHLVEDAILDVFQ